MGLDDPSGKALVENGRKYAGGRLLFKSHGIADEDLAIAARVLKALRSKKTRTRKVTKI